MFKTIEWTNDGVRMIDQTRLPGEEIYRTYTDYREVAEAIRSMVIRGAPAIGVAAAMGVAIGIKNSGAKNPTELRADFEVIADTLAKTRPTAVNLFWAIKRMRAVFDNSLSCHHTDAQVLTMVRVGLEEEAKRILAEDIDRKSTRLNSSNANISYAVFCLKKTKKTTDTQNQTPTTPPPPISTARSCRT